MSNTSDPAELIPQYAAAGLAVLPIHTASGGRCSCGRADCPSPGKHPRVRHGLADATTDLGQIGEWLARWPVTNWAVRPAEGLVVIDVDPRNGGATELQRLRDQHGGLPATLTARTGGGGLHIWYAYWGPTPKQLGPGLDLRTHQSGYLVAPPSVHASGRQYKWIDVEASTAPAPEWLRKLLAPAATPRALPQAVSGNGDRRLAGLVRTVAEAQPGSRNARLYWASCRAVDAGIDLGALIAAAVSAGLSRSEAERTAGSAARRLAASR